MADIIQESRYWRCPVVSKVYRTNENYMKMLKWMRLMLYRVFKNKSLSFDRVFKKRSETSNRAFKNYL